MQETFIVPRGAGETESLREMIVKTQRGWLWHVEGNKGIFSRVSVLIPDAL